MRRRSRIVLAALAVVLFLVISALLARALSVQSAELAAITSLVQAEARGDTTAMIREIQDCGGNPACRERVARDVARLAHPGQVKVLDFNQSAGFSLGSTVGTARVAWRAGTALPVVQCVRVRRAGNVLTGLRVELLEISLRIKTSADCPPRY